VNAVCDFPTNMWAESPHLSPLTKLPLVASDIWTFKCRFRSPRPDIYLFVETLLR